MGCLPAEYIIEAPEVLGLTVCHYTLNITILNLII